MRTVLPMTNGFYRSESLPLSAQEGLNCYIGVAEAPSLTQEYVVGTPGLGLLASVDASLTNRGVHTMAGVPYLVNGTKLYRLNESPFAMEELGDIPGERRVSMADNGTQLMILVPGNGAYIYNRDTEVFAEITDTDFRANGNPQYVVFIDSYFCCTTDSKRFIVSAPNDGLSWNALDFGSAEYDPDDIVGLGVNNNQLFIGGSQTLEGFQNIGGTDFPFQRNGVFIDIGMMAPLSVINARGAMLFIGGAENEGAGVWAVQGNSPVKISTNAVDLVLQELSQAELLEVYSWSYSRKGAFFVGFALPNTTLVYEFASKRWHERKSYVSGELRGYRVSTMVTAYGRVVCADVIDGSVGELSDEIYTEYGNNIVRRFVTQPFQNNMQSIFVPWLELTVESGVGNASEPSPKVTFERSLDGKTWYDFRERPIGAVGEYRKRAIWKRNGRASRFELFRFTYSGKTKFVAMQLTADINGGAK